MTSISLSGIFAGAIPFNDFMSDGIDKGIEVLNLHGGNPIHINLNVRKKLDKVLMGGKFAEQAVVNPGLFKFPCVGRDGKNSLLPAALSGG